MSKLPDYAMPFKYRNEREKEFLSEYGNFIEQSPLSNVERFENFALYERNIRRLLTSLPELGSSFKIL